MIPAFIVVFREGFEAFLGVAVILAFLEKAGRNWLRPTVYVAVGVSIVLSGGLGYLLSQNQSPLWEGIIGIVAIVLVVSFVIQVWKMAPTMRRDVEARVNTTSSAASRFTAVVGVFLFTVLVVTREGMEAAMILIQVRNAPEFLAGSLMGLAAAGVISWVWARFGHRVNLKRFFQVTGVFLLLFALQILVYSIHEFSEAEVLPASDAISTATERFSPAGMYGKWFSLFIVAGCGLWLAIVSASDRARRARPTVQ